MFRIHRASMESSTTPAWLTARPVTIQTAGGANLIACGTAVTVRALHDGAHAYFLFEWQDPMRSLKHVPLQKTAKGWRMVQNGYAIADETDYYEDKFAVLLSDAGRFAALRSAHFGPRPVEGLPGPSGGSGLHFTDDGTVLDVWHWRAVRTNPMGQAEEDYFGSLRPQPDSPLARYGGGYALDPAATGGPVSNWMDLLEGPNSRRFGRWTPIRLMRLRSPMEPTYGPQSSATPKPGTAGTRGRSA